MEYNCPSVQLRDRARDLRRNQTDTERHLWMRLRARQFEHAKFRRQQPIGPFIADFCCMEHKVIVELDGSPHLVQAAPDTERTAYLAAHGYRVLRFWNHDVLNDIDAVLERIVAALKSPHPDPLPKGEGEERERNC
jgi:very-short-patch-repair endonuclease